MNLLLTIFFLLFSGIGLASPLNNIVVFGDSLSDNGNLYEYMQHRLPSSPPYYEGRFSNGPVWVEHLASRWFPGNEKARSLNYAFGGAAISDSGDDEMLFTLKREVDAYLLAHQNQADPESLFIVWIGANNYLALPNEVEKTVNVVNESIKSELERLAQLGAKHVLVLNLPDLGDTPAARDYKKEVELSTYSRLHNEELSKSMDSLREQYPQVAWIMFDTAKLFHTILASPEEHGFKNTLDTCYDIVVDKPSRQAVLKMVAKMSSLKLQYEHCDGYLFFDHVHTSAAAHKILSENVISQLDAAGIEFEN